MFSQKRYPILLLVLLIFVLSGCAAHKKLPPQVKKRYTKQDRLAYQHFVNADLYELAGEVDSAISEYQIALEHQPENPEIRTALAKIYFQIGDFEEALIQGLKVKPKNSDSWVFLGDCYRHLGDVKKSLDAYHQAIELDNNKVDAYWYLANIHESTGNLYKAVENWKEVTLILPFNQGARLHLASLYVKMKRYDEALGQFQKVLELDPANQNALLGLGEIYENLKEYDKAIEQYNKILEDDYFNLELRRKLISIYYQSGHLDLAIKQAEIINHIFPQDTQFKKSLALLHMANKSYAQAETLLTEVAQQNPEDSTVYIYLGRIALERKNYLKAEQRFRKAISIQDTIIEAWVGLASVYFEQDSTKKGMEIYQGALQRVREKERIYYLMGINYNRKKDFKSGIEYLLKADSLKSNDVRIVFALASSYERDGQFDKAVKLFGEILKIEPENAMALNYLGYMFADKNVNLGESLELIKKAVQLEPQNGAYLDSYGWVLYRLKKYQEAEEQIKRSLKVISDDSVIYDHLGDIYKAQGKLEEAKEHWQKALELDPENEEIKKKLEKGL